MFSDLQNIQNNLYFIRFIYIGLKKFFIEQCSKIDFNAATQKNASCQAKFKVLDELQLYILYPRFFLLIFEDINKGRFHFFPSAYTQIRFFFISMVRKSNVCCFMHRFRSLFLSPWIVTVNFSRLFSAPLTFV